MKPNIAEIVRVAEGLMTNDLERLIVELQAIENSRCAFCNYPECRCHE